MLKILPILAGALLAVSCSRTQAGANHPKSADLPAVAVAKASVDDLAREIVLTAEFKPFQEVDVMSKVAGYVKKIYVDTGDHVKQGQLLATLEVPEMVDDQARARSALDRSEAEVARARGDVQRAESAHEIAHLSYVRLAKVTQQRPGLVAQQEIDDVHGRDLVAEAQVASAKSALSAAAQQVQVSRAELSKTNTLFDYTRVLAPFAGVITKRFADAGSMIQAGTASNTQAMPVVRLSENSLLRLILPVPESAVPIIRIGQSVTVQVPTLRRNFPGRVARFSEKVVLATRTMDTEVDVPNASLVLIPGMYAEVGLNLEKRSAVLSIPTVAVAMDADSGTGRVMTIDANNRIELRNVQLGMETADRVEVRSGLWDGALVVVGGRSSLRPGQQVRPKIAMAAASR